jgi:hypothetical protein
MAGHRIATQPAQAPLPAPIRSRNCCDEIEEVPMVVDLEGFTYLRQDQKGMLLGIYEIDYEHWAMDGAPWDYGMELSRKQIDRIENELILGFERYPVLQKVGVKTGSTAPSPSRRTAIRWSGRCGQARLLVRLCGDGGLPAGWRRGQVAGGMDDPWRTGSRCVGHGHRALRRLPRTSNSSSRPPGSSIPAAS